MTSGYAAFSTNISLHAKGNIKMPARNSYRQSTRSTCQ